MGGKLFGVDQLVEGVSVINGPKMDKVSKQSSKEKKDYLASIYALIELFSFFLLGVFPC